MENQHCINGPTGIWFSKAATKGYVSFSLKDVSSKSYPEDLLSTSASPDFCMEL